MIDEVATPVAKARGLPGHALKELSCTVSVHLRAQLDPSRLDPSSELCFSGTKYATRFPCPLGYYNPDPLTQSLDSCLSCPPGHCCGQENLTRASGL